MECIYCKSENVEEVTLEIIRVSVNMKTKNKIEKLLSVDDAYYCCCDCKKSFDDFDIEDYLEEN